MDTTFISPKEIVDYSLSFIDKTDDDRIFALSALHESEYDEIPLLLQEIAEDEKTEFNVEFKKFRALYVSKNLPCESSDYVGGLVHLNELWAKFEFPMDSPNVYYEFKEYSEEKFRELLKKHYEWIENEFLELAGN
jgi:hypothetical protein